MITNELNEGREDHGAHEHKIRIHIDRHPYHVEHHVQNGLQLRLLGGVPESYDLWEEREGDHEDKSIELTTEVHLREDMHFYSSQPTINPGVDHAAS